MQIVYRPAKKHLTALLLLVSALFQSILLYLRIHYFKRNSILKISIHAQHSDKMGGRLKQGQAKKLSHPMNREQKWMKANVHFSTGPDTSGL